MQLIVLLPLILSYCFLERGSGVCSANGIGARFCHGRDSGHKVCCSFLLDTAGQWNAVISCCLEYFWRRSEGWISKSWAISAPWIWAHLLFLVPLREKLLLNNRRIFSCCSKKNTHSLYLFKTNDNCNLIPCCAWLQSENRSRRVGGAQHCHLQLLMEYYGKPQFACFITSCNI